MSRNAARKNPFRSVFVPEYTTIDFNGERYLAGVRGRFTRVSALNYQEVGGDLPEGDAYDAWTSGFLTLRWPIPAWSGLFYERRRRAGTIFEGNPGSDFFA